MLEENTEKNLREAIALNLLQALTLFKCLYSTRELADYIPSQQAWYDEAMKLLQAKYQRQVERRQGVALLGLTAGGGSATFAATSRASAASGGEGQVEKKMIEGKLKKGDTSTAPGSFIPDDRLLSATGGFTMSSEMVDVTVDVQKWTRSNSVLLFGPPGTGKTRLVTQLHHQLGCNLIELQPSDFNDKFVGGSEKIIAALFQVAAANQPCIIFIDEIDALLQHRSARDPKHEKYLTAKFLEEMSNVARNKVDILICGATSLPWDIDVAAIRRFNRTILIDVPSPDALYQIFRFYLDQIHHDISTDDLHKLVSRFYGVTGDEVDKGIGSLVKSGFRELLQNKRKERRWSKNIVCGKAVWCVDPIGDTENSYAAMRLLGEQLWPKPVTFEALSTVMTQRGMSVTREVRLKYSRWDTMHQM